MKKETPEGAEKRAQYMARIFEILEAKHVIETGRLVVLSRQYDSRCIVKVLGYDFAIFRVETTGCAFGQMRKAELYGDVYRSDAGGEEDLILLSGISKIEPFNGSLPTMQESEKKRADYLSLICQTRHDTHHPNYYTHACVLAKGHPTDNPHHNGHYFDNLPPGVVWPKESNGTTVRVPSRQKKG